MNLWRSLEGNVRVQLLSADITGILDRLRRSGIEVWNVSIENDLYADLTISRRDYHAMEELTQKRGDTIRILRRTGLYWYAKAMVKRPVLLVGLLFLFLLSLYLPTRVLFLSVEGNVQIPTRQILAAAESCGVRFGASRREVRSEKVKNELLGALPQLQWVGVNTSGCVAVLSVRERADTVQTEKENGVSSLEASRDGIIVSCTVTQGSPKCAVGDAVTQGQILISGYTDCGMLLRATHAEGEIMAQTRRSVTAVTLPEKRIRGQQQSVSRNYSLILGKKRINLWINSGIWDGTCGRMYKEYYITLPGGFVLPVALAVDTCICADTSVTSRSSEEIFQELSGFCERYVTEQMVSGSILDSTLSALTGSSCRLEADYVCLEMIASRRQEKQE